MSGLSSGKLVIHLQRYDGRYLLNGKRCDHGIASSDMPLLLLLLLLVLPSPKGLHKLIMVFGRDHTHNDHSDHQSHEIFHQPDNSSNYIGRIFISFGGRVFW
ncbi:hypothetical protein Drorol1_Dr00021304 [Drosera rotundifolia]